MTARVRSQARDRAVVEWLRINLYSVEAHHLRSMTLRRLFRLVNRLAVTLAMLGAWVGTGMPGVIGVRPVAAAPAMSGVHVSGNQLLNGDNQPLVLRGVNRAGTEYACIQGRGIFDGPNGLNDDAQVPLMKSWGISEVNLGINEDCWLGLNGVVATYGGPNYIAALQHEVATLESNGIYPVISLFWEAPGAKKATGQLAMPDNDHAPALWQSVANTFKNDPRVILRLKEEPYPARNTDGNAAWQCWKSGDVQYAATGSLTPVSTTSNCSEGYATVGMQSLINIIRGTGATNVIQVPGVEYANSMTHFLDSAYRVNDTLASPQLMGVVDVYPIGNSCGSTACYTSEYAPVIAAMPFLAGEVGESVDGSAHGTTNVDALMSWFDEHSAGYSAWTWNTWGGGLQLIASYSTGAPNGNWGTDYQRHVLSLVGGTGGPTPTSASPPTPAPAAAESTISPSSTTSLEGPLVLYDGQVGTGFRDGTFGYTSRDACDTSVYYSPPCSYGIAYSAWGGLNFQATGGSLSTAPYTYLQYTLNTNGQPISNFGALFTTSSDAVINELALTSSNVTPLSDGWVQVSIPISELNPSNAAIGTIQLKNELSDDLDPVYYDDVQLVGGAMDMPANDTVTMCCWSPRFSFVQAGGR
jgi:hypothetical protein